MAQNQDLYNIFRQKHFGSISTIKAREKFVLKRHVNAEQSPTHAHLSSEIYEIWHFIYKL